MTYIEKINAIYNTNPDTLNANDFDFIVLMKEMHSQEWRISLKERQKIDELYDTMMYMEDYGE